MNLMEHALAYLEQGLPVFPIDHVSGIPKVKWKDFQTRLPEASTIKFWWTQWPDAMIGMPTGKISGLICIDFDVKNGADYADFPSKEIIRTDKVVSTSHEGGRHFYFCHPGFTIPNRIGIIQGVDVKGDGGYTVLPPSCKQGKLAYAWVSNGEPVQLSKESLEWLTKKTDEEKSTEPTWVSNLLSNGAEDGKRNQQTTRLAGYFASKGLSKDILMSLITNWNNTVTSDPLPKSEIKTIVDSVYQREQLNSKPVTTTTYEKFNLVGFKEYIRHHGDATYNWTVKNWLPSKTIAFMIAAPESYKTWMLLDLAVSIATGLDFIGNSKVEEKGPVIIIQQEDFHGQMAQRLSTIIYNKLKDKNPHNAIETLSDGSINIPNYDNLPIYLHPDRALRFDDPTVMDQLEEQIEQIRPRAVLIDPLYSTVDTDDYMTKAVKDLWRIKNIRDKYGCSFVIAHHTRKSTSGGTAREDSWGSQFLNAFLETGWQLRQTDTKNTITVRRHFKTFQGQSEVFLNFDINTETPPFTYKIMEVTKDSIKVEATSIITFLLKENLTAGALAKKLNCSIKEILDLTKKMSVEKIIARNKSGEYFIVNRGK